MVTKHEMGYLALVNFFVDLADSASYQGTELAREIANNALDQLNGVEDRSNNLYLKIQILLEASDTIPMIEGVYHMSKDAEIHFDKAYSMAEVVFKEAMGYKHNQPKRV